MTIILFLSAFLLLFYLLLIFYYSMGWNKQKDFDEIKYNFQTKVSVIIAARNERANIRTGIENLLAQTYPSELLEIIVVDDHSEDDTYVMAKNFEEPQLKVLRLEDYSDDFQKNLAFKKMALTMGIRHSSGDLIITTDADCIHQKEWVASIISYYEKFKPKLIAAPVICTGEKNFFEKFQSLDMLSMTAITAAAISNGFPDMCNGANLAYEKKVYDEVNGFQGTEEIPTGDDILLLLKIKRKHPDGIHFLKSKKAAVLTYAQPTLKDFISQRIRWVSKSTQFPDKRITAVLVLAYLFHLSILVNLLLGTFISPNFFFVGGISFLLKVIADYLFVRQAADYFGRKDLLRIYLPVQALHFVYVLAIGILGNLGAYSWKGRKIS